MNEILVNQVIYFASTAGGIAFALSGFLLGVRKGFDIMGIFILAFLTANGGGLVRDLLVDRTPIILISMRPFFLVAGVTFLAWLFRIHRLGQFENRWFFVICDGFGLVSFGISGALLALEIGVHFFGVLILSFLTATGGGILRDLLTGNVPEILHSGFYGTVAILLGVVIYVLQYLELINPYSLVFIFMTALALRLIAHHYHWKLPKLS